VLDFDNFLQKITLSHPVYRKARLPEKVRKKNIFNSTKVRCIIMGNEVGMEASE